jgi:hypothetical protein
MSQREKKKPIRDYGRTTSKSTDTTSTVATKSKIEVMREQYKNIKVPERTWKSMRPYNIR